MKLETAKERKMKKTGLMLGLGMLLVAGGVQAGPRVALMVQNRGGAALEGQLDAFGDLLGTRLSDAGFEVIRAQDVLDRFTESRAEESAQALRQAMEALQAVKSEGTVDGPSGEAPALRTAQLLGADYLVMASLVSLGSNTARVQAYGTSQDVTTTMLRVALRVLEGVQGAQIYGDTVGVSEKVMQTAAYQVETGDLVNTLLDRGAEELAGRVQGSLKRIEAAKPAVEWAMVTVKTPVAGAAVEVDGVVAGTAPGTIQVRPGTHEVRVTKEGYATWEKTVAMADGQVLEIALELSGMGLERKGELEAQAWVDDIAREQSAAEARAKVVVAEGAGKQMSESYIRLEGMPNESLTLGGESGPAAQQIQVIQQEVQ